MTGNPEFGRRLLPRKVLFCTSEAYPLAKTGGLADVSASLTASLVQMGLDLRLVVPAYPQAKAALEDSRVLVRFTLAAFSYSVTVYEGRLPGTTVTVWLVDIPGLFNRHGGPYQTANGADWPDNAQRFGAFARVVVALACGHCGVPWRPDLVHSNDWQTGLVPALLKEQPSSPATVFTIHNLAYQGLFSYDTFCDLKLGSSMWSLDSLEFYGRMSFIKGGIVYADRLTTVSPTYAREIQTEAFGAGLDGLLRHHAGRLTGILNGADYTVWNPATDQYLDHNFGPGRLEGKRLCKRQLQHQLRLPKTEKPVLAFVGRLVEQKGVELLIDALPQLLQLSLQLVILGTGEARFEKALRQAAEHYSGALAFVPHYDEAMAHRIEAGADMFLMPSLYEPCGLNQIYSLRYGTIPIVHGVGGLADTVLDATPARLDVGTATGFVFHQPLTAALLAGVGRALSLFEQRGAWEALVGNAMAQDFSWSRSAHTYLDVYQLALAESGASEDRRKYPVSVRNSVE